MKRGRAPFGGASFSLLFLQGGGIITLMKGGVPVLLIAFACVDDLSDDPAGLPLSEDRIKKLEKLKISQKRRQSIAAELLLIRLVKELDPDAPLPLSIDTEVDGRPFLRDHALHFSLSHSGSYAACAVSDGEIGIDLQRVKAVESRLLRRCMSQDEQSYILSADDPDAAYTEIWTKKESYAKARGLGLRLPFSSFSVYTLPDGVDFWNRRLDEYSFTVCRLDGPAAPDQIIKEELP